MKIETEFNKGDKVWYVNADLSEVREGAILKIIYDGKQSLNEIELVDYFVPDEFVASTREALKAKLIDNVNKLFSE